jgi:filamentous hemagglutinin family protein
MKLPSSKTRGKKAVLTLLLPAFAFNGGPLQANPKGGVVVGGAQNATITQISANHLRIHQKVPTAIINWQDFSIAPGTTTRFVQPTNGTVLNRVVTGNVSQIHGQLKGNANVYVVNPNGIVIGSQGVIDVAGRTVLSTLDISNDDFLKNGPKRFQGSTNTGITNFGTISSSEGDVVLMGGFVDNQGQIGALNGNVAIGVGGDILLSEGAGSQISVRGASDYDGPAGINNSGTIRGASVELKAHGNVYALAINNGGAIRANGADRSGGRVRLTASGGSSNINLGSNSSIVARSGGSGGSVEIDAGQGDVNVAGRIDARGSNQGGSISVVGNRVEQAEGSVVDASGSASGGRAALDGSSALNVAGTVRAESSQGAGGRVDLSGATVQLQQSAAASVNGASRGGVMRIGGDFQGRDTDIREADSTRVESGARLSADSAGGDAGTVIVWANDDTLFYGDITASARGAVGNGGLIEVSGKLHLDFDGTVAATSVGGRAGLVLFDPGDVIIGSAGALTAPLGSPVTASFINISAVNNTLQGGTNVLVVTESGSIEIQDLGGGGNSLSGAIASNRHASIQWTNSQASFGAFASGSIIVNNHIRTSGAGSVNLLAGWGGTESDFALAFDPQSAWDFYMGQGLFGQNGGSVIVGSGAMARHVEVGSRFGHTNVSGFDVRVVGSDIADTQRFAMIGFRDGGQIFAPRLNKGGLYRLDMKVGAPTANGAWLLADGRNAASGVVTANQAPAGIGDPIVAIAGQHEVDIDGDGIIDGVRGVNSTGVVTETFIPYANHYNSVIAGNWWWQQIEDAGQQNAANPGLNRSIAGVVQIADPLGFGGLRPEHGAGTAANPAHINVIARGNVTLQAGTGQEQNSASIGHGGPNRANGGGAGTSQREVGTETVTSANFSHAGIEDLQMERRWSFNGSQGDSNATGVGRLAAIHGNINVLAGVNSADGVSVDRSAGTVSANFLTAGDVVLRANQTFKTSAPSSNAHAHIGHGGVGQFGEFNGNIRVEAGGSVTLEAGEATRATATIGHATFGHVNYNPPSNADQQLRFFATTGDFDNPNLRRGELFSGNVTTGFDPALDPARFLRYTLGDGYAFASGVDINGNTVWDFFGHNPGSGNFVPIAANADGTGLTGRFVNFNAIPGNEAQREINMSPLLYTQGFAGGGIHSPGVNSQGRASLAPLTLSPVSTAAVPIIVEALDGSVVSGFHGNITVTARNGGIALRGFVTPEFITGNVPRDNRSAQIGHGGRGFEQAGLGAGYRAILGTPSVVGIAAAGNVTGNVEGREIIDYRYTNGNEIQTGSRSVIGEVGGARNRAVPFMTITGDIDVSARRDILLSGGNDIGDFARIGHGGISVSDYETSSFILGDIRVRAGGNISLIGGGAVTNFVRAGDVDMRAYAQIGHGGYRNGFFGFFGDIDVAAGGSITLRNGAHSWNYAMVGHGGAESFGQMGGEFLRNEHFWLDGKVTTIDTTLLADTARVVYASSNGGVDTIRDFSASGAGTLVGADRHTANISLVAGGGVTLEHIQEGLRQPPGRNGGVGNVNSQAAGLRTRASSAHIGHGGFASHVINANNTATNYGNKIGDVVVRANGGSVTMGNGTGEQRWSRIGHGVAANDRVDDSTNFGYIRAVRLVGDISVTASRDVIVNADAANENERIENFDSLFGSPTPSRWNPVVIGHGGVYNNLDILVMGRGENVNGIAASSSINVRAGRNMSVVGGKGIEASYAQVGHGFASDQGDDFARLQGIPYGFAGNISVSVAGDLLVRSGNNAWTEVPSGLIDGVGRSVTGAFGAIGHGGYQLDAPSFGNIAVYVGRDLAIRAQQRTDPGTTTVDGSGYSVVNPQTDAVSSAFNFAKIGHFAVENGNVLANFNDAVRDANQEGDIDVVVGRDLLVAGGTTPNVDTQTIYGAFAQIGHGGPAIVGNLLGNISVLVGRDATVRRGSEITASSLTPQRLNNYVKIGHGDYLFDTSPSPLALFNKEGQGQRFGDIVFAAGRNASFNGAMVGHADPRNSIQPNQGNLQVAVSRSDPFFGGEGILAATNGTVFTSGGAGTGSQLQFFIPSRSNNLMDATTRINESVSTFAVAPRDFASPFNRAAGQLAGRADEVYLTPDLWWDQQGLAAQGGFDGAGRFPTDAVSGQGGAIATVNAPGGLFNLDSLAPGVLGDSAALYRGGNGVSGAGNYTLYYDAIEAVKNTFPVQPIDPDLPVPPPLLDMTGFFNPSLLFVDTYDAFFRDLELWSGVGGEGDYLFALLGLFERDSETVEDSGVSRLENRLDQLFGKRRASDSPEELEEEERSRRARGSSAGALGMSYYLFVPGTNTYSSFRVFGHQAGNFYPAL